MSDTHRDTLKMGGYGGWGTTKTLQIASLIREFGPENVGILSCEDGLNTIQSALGGVTVWPVSNVEEARAVWKPMAEFAKKPGVWVCVDGGTTLMTWYEQDVWKNVDLFFDAYIKKETITPSLKPYQRFVVKDKETIDPQSIYAVVGRNLCNLYMELLRLGCNFYINFMQEMHGQSGRDKALPWGPDIPGKVGKNFVMAKTDYVFGLTYNEQRKVVAQCDPASKIYLAKTRNDRKTVEIPPEIQEFDLGKFVRLVQPTVTGGQTDAVR